jgi:drug/metabolite transporter (DMT)-like permease
VYSTGRLLFRASRAYGACITSGLPWYRGGMVGLAALSAVFASAVLITGADALIKRISHASDFWHAAANPLMLLICALYLVQILLAIYIFHKGDLAIYANLFIAFYSVLMVLFGVVFFREHLTSVQVVGILLALGGAMLINSGW